MLGNPDRLAELLEEAGFTEVNIEAVDLRREHESFEELWETTLDLSRNFHDAVLERPEAEIEAIRSSLAQRFAPFTGAGGELAVPGRTLVASASA